MPFVRLTIADPDIAVDVRSALARDLSALLESGLGKEYEHTVVHIDLVPADRWYVAGVHPGEGTGAHLEVSITAGTNTPEEKAAFISDAHELLGRRLGVLPAAVYVALYELDGRSYGYNGITQAARKNLDPAGSD
ncbi:tautomerase family protein [Nocardia seriolae]|nr:tautomerase family protein [Nocardia seriolae]OJF79979.1 hypothetical protein NS14008_13200 [Nocardia seriolae]PSK28257.1 hypothetical protein C6575_27555 [Nocardia seriolae]QOW36085.1 tautomerase family protein [Nocardia seriolae]QUN16418.1 tautomerase family protein [Nocardia seriolae]WKY50032.1 tautomerase family protein [Nocardia seriolae]